MTCTPHSLLCGDEMGRAQCVWGREEAYTGFWWENLRESDHFVDPGRDGRKADLHEVGITGLSWLQIETGGAHL
jgi:hypothetical protein